MKKLALITLTVILLIFFSCNKEEDDDSNDNNSNTPANSGTFTDNRDGKTYEWIRIGNQVWMAENLAYEVNEGCWAYNNDESNVETYGYLYDWETAINVSPDGWHLPSDEEWKTLEMHLGMSQSEADDEEWRGTDEGKKLKSTSEFNGTDQVGFNALPGGWYDTLSDEFDDMGYFGVWWTATEVSTTEAWFRLLSSNRDVAGRYREFKEEYGFSVRCIED